MSSVIDRLSSLLKTLFFINMICCIHNKFIIKNKNFKFLCFFFLTKISFILVRPLIFRKDLPFKTSFLTLSSKGVGCEGGRRGWGVVVGIIISRIRSFPAPESAFVL